MFPVWFLQVLVFGGLFLCVAGIVVLLLFLLKDLKQKNIW